MATNKLVLRTIIELMQDYVPVYQPIYPLLLGKSQAWAEEVGQIQFKRLVSVGDLRGGHVTPKDTEMKQVSVSENLKVFKKYFLANQFTQSALQDRAQVEDVIKQVLDEYHRHMDELVMFGEGTSALSDVINNGIFWSNDPNYDLESSATVNGSSGADPLIDLHAKVMASSRVADTVAGRKLIIFYGDAIVPLYQGIFSSGDHRAFKPTLEATLGSNYSTIKLPPALTTQSESGWLIVNLDQVKLHYTQLPTLKAQGINEEKMYVWSNFLTGSAMVEVLAQKAVIHQPATVSS
jgi:hypothetical protein